jgi:hypothetical protein
MILQKPESIAQAFLFFVNQYFDLLFQIFFS